MKISGTEASLQLASTMMDLTPATAVLDSRFINYLQTTSISVALTFSDSGLQASCHQTKSKTKLYSAQPLSLCIRDERDRGEGKQTRRMGLRYGGLLIYHRGFLFVKALTELKLIPWKMSRMYWSQLFPTFLAPQIVIIIGKVPSEQFRNKTFHDVFPDLKRKVKIIIGV